MAGEVRAGGQGEAVASGERRPNIPPRPGVLRRATLSPFHSKYKTLASSSSDSSCSPAAGSQWKQESGFLIDLSDGTEPSGNTPTQESRISLADVTNALPNGKDWTSRNRQSTAWPSVSSLGTPEPSSNWAVFPPSSSLGQGGAKELQASSTNNASETFQATPLSWLSDVPKSGQTNNTKDLFQSCKANEENGIAESMVTNGVQSTIYSSDPFQATPPSWLSDVPKIGPSNHTSDIFKPYKSSEENGISRNMVTNKLQATTTNHASDLFQATPPAWLSETPNIGPSSHTKDIFQLSKANEENDIVTNGSKEAKQQSGERDYLLEYILASQKKDDNQPTPLPTLTSDGPSSFFPPPVITEDLFKTPDIFSAPLTSVSSDIFSTPLSSAENGVFQSTPLFQTPASTPAGINAFDPFSNDNPVNADPFKPYKSQFDRLLAPPTGNHSANTNGTFQDDSPSVSPTEGGLMFRRRHPKPVPRRPSRIPAQTVQNHCLPTAAQSDTPRTPVIHIQSPPTSYITPPTAALPAKNSIQNSTPAEEENNNQVYEDVLLIGQEKCVEDWPEDSPELSSDWKPAGKLRLRRDSVKFSAASEGGGTSEKKLEKAKRSKRFSLISRRGSKEKFGDELKVAQTATLGRERVEKTPDSLNGSYGGTLPWGTKFQDGGSDDVFSSDPDEHNVTGTSKPVKQKKKSRIVVPQLRYRTSKIKSPNAVSENGSGSSSLLQVSKDDLLAEASVLPSGEKMGYGEVMKELEMKDCRPKEPLKFKPPVPQRPSKSAFEDEQKMTNRFSFDEKSKGLNLNEAEGATGYTPSWESQMGYQDDPYTPGGSEQFTTSLDNSGSVQDSSLKRPVKLRFPHLPRRGSKSMTEEAPQKGGDLFKGIDGGSSELNGRDGYSEKRKPPILRVHPLSHRDSEGMRDSETPDTGADLFKPENNEGAEHYMEEYCPDSKPHKATKSPASNGDAKAKEQAAFPEDLDPPGATSGDYFLSEAAKAEWMSSQMDVRRIRDPDEEERLEGVDEEEEEGDTDSLMEWWNTVERWDELPSDEEITLKEDETKSFTEIAGKVHRGLRVFYKVFTEQAEVLYQHVMLLYAIADDLSNFHRRAKIANITGGTTTAVGGVAAIAGLALAPVTFGASLIVSAVGLGVATAGGITAASAAISDNVHDMNDRKKIEVVVQDYEKHLTELQSCLRFISEGIRRLRCHPLLRRNNYYAGDWEVRRALQTVSLVSEPVERAEDIVNSAMAALGSVCKSIDKYFTKDSRELRKGCKKEVTMRVRMLSKQLHEGLVELNSIRDQVLDASGNI